MREVNKGVIRKWVEALRSGEYKQGTGTLRNGDCFCCLGVLCDLAEKEGVVSEVDIEDGIYEYEHCYEYLPRSVVEWAGLKNDIPKVHLEEDQIMESLPILNDDYGLTFTELADLIERTYLQGE